MGSSRERWTAASVAAGWALLAVAWNGWRYGVDDHSIHLAYVDQVLHPERWAGDLLAGGASRHPSLLWAGMAGPVELLGGPGAYAAAQLGVLFATALGLRALFRAQGGRVEAQALALLASVVALPALGGVRTLDPLLLNRTVALPWVLFGMVAALGGRRGLAGGLVGVAVSLHAPSGVAAAVGLLVAGLLVGERKVPGRFLLGLGLGAAPAIGLWIAGGGGVGARVDPEWFEILRARLGHHLVSASWPAEVWLRSLAVPAVAAVAGLVALRRGALEGADRWTAACALGLFGYALLGGLLGERGGVALALQLEAWQAARLGLLVCLAPAARGLLGAIPLRAPPVARLAALASVGVAVVLLGRPQMPRRVFAPFGPPAGDPVAAMAAWARAETPEGALFYVPPHAFADFRGLAMRPVYATWKEGGEAVFDRDLALRWRARVEASCACDFLGNPEGAEGGLSGMRRRIEEGWERAEAGAAERAAGVGARYLVVGADAPSGGRRVFRSGPWSVRDLGASPAR